MGIRSSGGEGGAAADCGWRVNRLNGSGGSLFTLGQSEPYAQRKWTPPEIGWKTADLSEGRVIAQSCPFLWRYYIFVFVWFFWSYEPPEESSQVTWRLSLWVFVAVAGDVRWWYHFPCSESHYWCKWDTWCATRRFYNWGEKEKERKEKEQLTNIYLGSRAFAEAALKNSC